MRGVVLIVLPIACCLAAASASGADPWKSATVLPKSAQVRLVDETGRDSGSVIQIDWPAKVERINGQWLQIRDSGAYSAPPFAGWVRKAEMLRLSTDGGPEQRWEDPRSYFTDKIEADHTAPGVRELHWLRGIYSESQGETDTAIEDYCLAAGAKLPEACRKACQQLMLPRNRDRLSVSLAQDTAPAFVTSDACLRLGRLLAQKNSLDETSSNDAAWQEAFSSAEKTFVESGQGLPRFVPPGLYLEWGVAAAGRYKASLHPPKNKTGSTDITPPVVCGTSAPKTFFDLAETKLNRARELNGGWSKPYFDLGELYLAQGIAKPTDKAKTPASKNGQPAVKSEAAPAKNAPPAATADKPAKNDTSEPNGSASEENPASVAALQNAVAAFDYAIRVDPGLKEAYRERAKAFYYQAEPPKSDQPEASASSDSTKIAGADSPPCPKESKGKTSDTATTTTETATPSPPAKGRPTRKERLLRKAADSALIACELNFYQDAPSLEQLAEIIGALAAQMADQKNADAAAAYYDQAAEYAGNAAELETDRAAKFRLKKMKESYLNCKNCPGNCKPPVVNLEEPVTPLLRQRPSFTE